MGSPHYHRAQHPYGYLSNAQLSLDAESRRGRLRSWRHVQWHDGSHDRNGNDASCRLRPTHVDGGHLFGPTRFNLSSPMGIRRLFALLGWRRRDCSTVHY